MMHTITIPDWTPPRLNQIMGRHWSISARLKKDAEAFVKLYALEQDVPLARCRRRVSLLVTLSGRQKQPDRDAYDKALLDALVRTGLLLNDDDKGLAGRMEVLFARGPKSETQIHLEDVP